MKESIGYTVTLNIVIIFITIVFAFISITVVYFKSNKVSNIITNVIEKREGYYEITKTEINTNLEGLGYARKPVNCEKYHNAIRGSERDSCESLADGKNGYCVFYCTEKFNGQCYYYYKISTNLMINMPIINSILDIPIFSNTNRLYDFENQNC